MLYAAITPNTNQYTKAACANVQKVSGLVMAIHRKHHWFRVQYVTPSGSRYHECFPLSSAEPESELIKYGYHATDGRSRGRYDTRYNKK